MLVTYNKESLLPRPYNDYAGTISMRHKLYTEQGLGINNQKALISYTLVNNMFLKLEKVSVG